MTVASNQYVDAIGECANQGYAAAVYAAALRAMQRGEIIDWPAMNRAIIDRWSESGLKNVKRLAWKIA